MTMPLPKGYIHEKFPCLEKYGYSLFELIETVHQCNTGSGDYFYEEDYIVLRNALKERLKQWNDEFTFSKGYDNTVKALIVEVLNERCVYSWLDEIRKEDMV